MADGISMGGVPLGPKQILRCVRARRYRGYLQEEIALSAARCEPRRSEELRKFRQSVSASLRIDLARYRDLVRALRRETRSGEASECTDLHTAVSLKHNHLFNDFAHLDRIDDLLSVQLDLFDC
jgi:hypothetical protein